jgi:hypothetical protein
LQKLKREIAYLLMVMQKHYLTGVTASIRSYRRT